MSNPFTKAYDDLRKPYLEGKIAKKDYDGDGKVETGTQEYMGSRDKAIKKAMGKKVTKEHHQKDADGNVIPHGDGTPSSVEEEQLDELKASTLKSYIDKAQVASRSLSSKREVAKKKQGIDRAKDQYAEKQVRGKVSKKPKGKYDIKNYEGQKKNYLMGKETRKGHDDYGKIPKRTGAYREEVEVVNELSKKTLGGYIKKASKETRGNMVATQHGSGIPKKAKDIKLKQVNKRLKGMEKAGEKLAKEEVKMSRKEYSKIHKDFKSDDPKNPRTTKYVKGKGTVSMPVKFTDEYHYLEKHLELQLDEAGTLGTLHVADLKGNTPAWQNRMGVNKKGQRLYDFGKDLIQKLSYEYPDDMKMTEAKGTSAMKKYLDAKAKKLSKEKEAQKPEYKNNPAFGDPSHHSNRKNRKEAFSDWRSDFIWEGGDSVKKT